MPSNEDTQQKVSNFTLPYNTDAEDVLRLIEAIKKKPDNEKAIKEIYNKSNFETSRKTLELLGILDSQLSFSKVGKDLAIEKEEQRKSELFLKFFLSYQPYGHFLESTFHNGHLPTTETETIKDYWWKHSYGSSGNNREDGVVAFGKLIQLAGLGKFVPGRKGKPSRIEWNIDAKVLIDSACTSNENNSISDDEFPATAIQENIANASSVLLENLTNTELPIFNFKSHSEQSQSTSELLLNTKINVSPNISINVDMSNWDNNKIVTFFKAAYGIFNDDRETDLSTTCSQSVSKPSDGYSDS